MTTTTSVTRLGYLLKVLVTNFLTKVAHSIMQLFGLYWNMITFLIKTVVATFQSFSEKLGHFLFQHLVTLRTTTTMAMSLKMLISIYPVGTSEESGLWGCRGWAVEAVGAHDEVAVAAPRQSGVEALTLFEVALLVVLAAEAAREASRGWTTAAPLEHAFPELKVWNNKLYFLCHRLFIYFL